MTRERVAEAHRRLKAAPRPNLIERRVTRFLRQPPSVRTAASVIVTATALVVVASGVCMRIFDHHEYSSVWVGMWWALQTVTTVGYGDVTPTHRSGRIIASFVMFEGIAFLAIITAAVTSVFVARAYEARGREAAEQEEELVEGLEGKIDELARRFDGFEATLLRLAGEPGRPTSSP